MTSFIYFFIYLLIAYANISTEILKKIFSEVNLSYLYLCHGSHVLLGSVEAMSSPDSDSEADKMT